MIELAIAALSVTFFGWAVIEAWLDWRNGPPPPDELEDDPATPQLVDPAWAAEMERIWRFPAHIPDHEIGNSQ